MTEKIFKELGDILAKGGISYNRKDVLLICAVTHQFNKSGYKLAYQEIANFLTNKKNLEMIKKEGLSKTIEAMANMKLGTIKREEPKLSRNAKCKCGSGLKYKKCCIK